jgi:hypothetical protein
VAGLTLLGAGTQRFIRRARHWMRMRMRMRSAVEIILAAGSLIAASGNEQPWVRFASTLSFPWDGRGRALASADESASTERIWGEIY